MKPLFHFPPRFRHRVRSTAQLLLSAAHDFFRDNGPTWAAAVAYYSLLSVFPLLLFLGSVASYFVDPHWAIHQATEALKDYLPRGSRLIEQIVRETLEVGRGGGLFFLLALVWSGTLVFNAIIKGLGLVFGTEEDYTFLKRIFIRLMMLLTVGLMFLAALASPLILRALRATLGILPAGSEFLFQLSVTALPALFLLAAFLLTYRFVPKRKPRWRAAFLGACIAIVLFATAKPVFLDYIEDWARYSIIYGSLAGVVVVILWTWILAMIGFFGAQVCAHSDAALARH